MEPKSGNPPVIVIVGETASGKSALALALAKQFNGEIICADSRTVYKGMDIGTAKPSSDERQLVVHHLLDIATPDKQVTAAEFKAHAQKAIQDVSSRGKIPFLVGGTGLYIDAILFDYQFSGPPNPELRRQLEGKSVEELQAILRSQNIPLPTNERNPRHLLRQIETGGSSTERRDLRSNTLVIGMSVHKELLKVRIAKRVDAMLQSGLEPEVRMLVDLYGWEAAPLQTIGYQEFREYVEGHATLQDVREAIVRATIQYAKRQRTWFRRNKSIHWICKKEEAVDLITTFLNN